MDRARLGAVAGIAGALLLTAGWIAGGLAQPATYSWSRQEISDLGALTAEHAWIWNLADSLSGALIAIFAVGLFSLVKSNRAGRIGAVLIGIVGVGGVLDGLLREDCPLSTSEACQRLQDGPGLSWHHQAHDIESVLVFLAMIGAPFALTRALGRLDGPGGLRRYSLATGALLIAVAIAYALLYGEAGGGIAQRLLATIFMAWILVLAIWMLRADRRIEARSFS
jgi:hypothetical membrane protein